jgi:hypothetical protein
VHRITKIDYLYYLDPTTKPTKEITNQTMDPESAASVSTSTNRELNSNNAATTTYYIANDKENNAMNGTPIVTIFIGIGVAILIVVTAIVVVVTLALLYLQKKFSLPKPKSDYDDSYSTLCRGETKQLQPHSQQPPTDLYDQIQLSPSTGQAEVTSKQNINIPSSHQPKVSPNIGKDQCNTTSEQDNVSTSEQPRCAAIKKKQKKKKHMKRREFPKNASAGEKEMEGTVLCSHSALDTKKNQIKQRGATPISVHSTESPEALYSAVKKKPKANRDKEEKVPPPPPHSIEELYTAVKKNVQGSAMEEEEGPPQIPPHTIEDLYTAVMKKPKGDSTDTGTDGAPPIPPHTVDDC